MDVTIQVEQTTAVEDQVQTAPVDSNTTDTTTTTVTAKVEVAVTETVAPAPAPVVETVFTKLEKELKNLKTAQEVDKFYNDQLAALDSKEETEVVEIYRALYRLALTRGNLKCVLVLAYSDGQNCLLQSEDEIVSDYFNVCAQNNQTEVLKYLMWSYAGDYLSKNLLGIDLKGLYDKGLYDMFLFVLDTYKYQTDYSEDFANKLKELLDHIKVNYRYVDYVVSNPYTTKVVEVQTLMEKISKVIAAKSDAVELAKITL